MARFWNRKKDPHNIEELMVAEHKRLIEVNADQAAEIIALNREMGDLCTSHAEALIEAEHERQEIEDRLKSVIAQNNGFIDCHEPTLLYRAAYTSTYNIKNYIDGETIEEKIATIDKLLRFSSNLFIKEASEVNCRYNGAVCTFEEHTFPYKLSVKSNKMLNILYYDPAYKLLTLIDAKTSPVFDEWCKADPAKLKKKLEEKTKSVLREARAALVKQLEESSDNE